VVIRELGTAKKATAGKATYDTVEDTVVLTENPYLEERDQGFFTKGADKITYMRGKQQFKAEGDNMQIEFGIPEDRTRSSNDFFGRGDTSKAAAGGAGDIPTKKETPAP
jgi:lipopolysaccharide export system protein LptA